jgi:hypothetical protein
MIFKTTRSQMLMFLVCALLISSACHNYYQAIRPPAVTNLGKATSIDSLKEANRYFILRAPNSEAYNMKNIRISQDQKSLTCYLDSASNDHKLHLKKGRGGNLRYNKLVPGDREVLNEVHLYVQTDTTVRPGPYVLSMDKIQKIEIIEKDRKRTTSSYVIGSIGYTIGTLALVAIIIAATKSSCPFVSAYDGNHFSLQGEIYGGAIYPQLVRHDYMPLKMEPLENGSLQLKISNELQEHQYTDMAELWVVTHDKRDRVLADEKGNLYSIASTHAPIEALLNNKKEVSKTLLNAGDNMLLYMDDTLALDAANEVVMKFANPTNAKAAKLLLSLKNSYFLDLLYGELAKGFGSYYTTYIQQQQKKPAAELLKWVKDQDIPLEVSVKTTGGWKKITDLTTIGPLATRDIIVPLELPADAGAITEIRLKSGFMFWEIDYAAIDYSKGNNFSIQKITPSKAVDETGKNILPELLREDAVYLSQPDIGNTATISYKTAALKDNSKTRSYILHSKGYYEHIRNSSAKPNIAFLNQFKNPGAFPLYGLRLYKQMSQQTLSGLAKTN